MIRFNAKKPVKLKLFLSYFLIFSIPLLLMGFISYYWLLDITVSQTENAYRRELISIRDTIDRQINDLNGFAIQLSQTSWLKKLMIKKYNVIDDDAISITEILDYNEELLLYNIANNFIDNIFIYFIYRDMVLSSINGSDHEYFLSEVFQIDGMDSNSCSKMITSLNNCNMFAADNVTIKHIDKSGVVYLQSLPVSDNTDIRASLIAFIDKSVIEKTISSSFNDSSVSVYITDRNNQAIAAKNINDENLAALNDESLFRDSNNDIIKTTIDNNLMYIIRATSSKYKWQYYTLIAEKTIMKDVKKVQYIIILLVFVSIVIGGVLSYLIALKNYRPLNSLLLLLKDKPGGKEILGKYDEYQWLNSEITSILEQQKQLRMKIEKDKPAMIDLYLIKLLDAESNKDEIIEILKLADVAYTFTSFFCCVISNNPDTNSYCDNKKLNELFNTAGELCKINIKSTIIGSYTVYICNCFNDDYFEDFISSLKHSFLDHDVKTLVGVGGLYIVDKINKSYQEAVNALNYRYIKSENNLIMYKETRDENWFYYYPADKERCITNCLKSGDFEKAVKHFEEIAEQNLIKEPFHFEAFKYFMISAELTAFKIVDELSLKDVVSTNRSLLFLSDNIDDMKAYIVSLYSSICNAVDIIFNEDRENGSMQFKKGIIDFIDNHYTDMSISLAVVSEKFNISPSYLSRYFKEQYKCNFLDYINKKRINHAKKLMINKQTDIFSVLKESGFNNIVTFRRLFKKYEGVSPSSFRDRIC
jgi:two-component system, response regulator YesN